jgi:hypothetical protein
MAGRSAIAMRDEDFMINPVQVAIGRVGIVAGRRTKVSTLRSTHVE